MVTNNTNLKLHNAGNKNDLGNYIDEIPVKSMSGDFFVVRGNANQRKYDPSHEGGARSELTRIGGEGGDRIKNQELRIKNGEEGEKKLDPSDERPSHSTGCNGARIRNWKFGNWKKQTPELPPPPPMVRNDVSRALKAPDTEKDLMKKNIAPFIISAEDEEDVATATRGNNADTLPTEWHQPFGRWYAEITRKEGEEREECKEVGEGKIEARQEYGESGEVVPSKNSPQPTFGKGGSDRESLKIREIERNKGNTGVNIVDIIKKREEVEREVEEKVQKIVSSIKYKVLSEEYGKKKLEISDEIGNWKLGKEDGEESRRNGAMPCSEEGREVEREGVQKLEIGNWKLGKFERFKNILKTRIKGTRNNAQLFEALTKKEEEGGIRMSGEQADEIVKIVSSILNCRDGALPRLRERREGAEGKEGTRDGAEDSTDIRAEVADSEETVPRKNPPQPPFTKGGSDHPLSPQPPFTKGGSDHPLSPQPLLRQAQDRLFGKGGSAETTVASSNFYAINRMASDSGKTKIEDIKYKSKLTGPVDEIASFRVKDFRQLSDDPVKAAEMIKNKIDILEDDSFAKKIEGIKAWRNSEIFKAYLEMGQRAIEQKLEIRNLKLGENSLTEEEFYAIMDLNRWLRF